MNKISNFLSKLTLKKLKYLSTEDHFEDLDIKRALSQIEDSGNNFFNLVVLEEKIDEKMDSLFCEKVSYEDSLVENEITNKFFKDNNQITEDLGKTLNSLGLTQDHYSYYKIMDNILIPQLRKKYLKEAYPEVLHREAVFSLIDKLDQGTLPKKYAKWIKKIETISSSKESEVLRNYFEEYPEFKKEIEDLISKPQKRIKYIRNYANQTPELAPLLQGDFRGEGQWLFVQTPDHCQMFKKDKYSKQNSLLWTLAFARLQAQGRAIESLVVAFNSKGEVFSFIYPELVLLKSLMGKHGNVPDKYKQELSIIKKISSVKDLSWDYFMSEGKVLPTYEK